MLFCYRGEGVVEWVTVSLTSASISPTRRRDGGVEGALQHDEPVPLELQYFGLRQRQLFGLLTLLVAPALTATLRRFFAGYLGQACCITRGRFALQCTRLGLRGSQVAAPNVWHAHGIALVSSRKVIAMLAGNIVTSNNVRFPWATTLHMQPIYVWRFSNLLDQHISCDYIVSRFVARKLMVLLVLIVLLLCAAKVPGTGGGGGYSR